MIKKKIRSAAQHNPAQVMNGTTLHQRYVAVEYFIMTYVTAAAGASISYILVYMYYHISS